MMENSLWIDKEGRWFFRGEEITHRKTYLLFCRNLTLDETGQLLLRVGKEECRVEAEDAPFIVKSVDFVSAEKGQIQSLDLILNDETREPLNPQTLRVGPQNVLYCRVRKGRFAARFSRGAYQLLFPYIQHDEKRNCFFLVLGGEEHILS